MAFDVSSLFIGVDSTQVRTGTQDLERFQQASARAGQGADRFAGELTKLAQVAAAFITFDLARRILETAEAFTLMQYRVERLTRATGEGKAVFDQLKQSAQAVGAPIATMVETFSRISAVKDTLGLTNKELATVTLNVQKLAVISGASTQEAQNAVKQIGELFSKGKVQGEDLQAIMNTMPDLIDEVAKGLGKTTTEFLTLARQGRITGADIANSMLKITQSVNQDFAQMPTQMAQAWQKLSNQFQSFVGRVDQGLGITRGIVADFNALTRALEAIENMIPGLPEWLGGDKKSGSVPVPFGPFQPSADDPRMVLSRKRSQLGEQEATQRAELQDRRNPLSPGLRQQHIEDLRADIERLEIQIRKTDEAAVDLLRMEQADVAAEQMRKLEAIAKRVATEMTAMETAFAAAVEATDLRIQQARRLAAVAGGTPEQRRDVQAAIAAERNLKPGMTPAERGYAIGQFLPKERELLDVQAEEARTKAITETKLQAEGEERLAAAASRSAAAMERAANANKVAAFEALHGAGTGKAYAESLERITSAQEAQKLNERIRELDEETKASTRLAVAVASGEISFQEAELRAKAHAEALRVATETGQNFTEVYQRLLAGMKTRDIADRTVDLAKQTTEMEHSVAALEAWAIASERGEAAAEDQEISNQAMALAFKVAGENVDLFNESYEKFLGLLQRRRTATQRGGINLELDESRESLALAKEQLRTVGMLPYEREKSLALTQKQLELDKKFGIGHAEIKQAILANVAATMDLHEAARLVQEDFDAWQAPVRQLVADIDNIFTDFFADVFKGGEDAWEKMLDAMEDMAAQFAAEIARLFIIRPVLAGIAGQLGMSGYGTGGMGGAAGGMGGMGGIGSLFGMFGGGGGGGGPVAAQWINPDTGMAMGGGTPVGGMAGFTGTFGTSSGLMGAAGGALMGFGLGSGAGSLVQQRTGRTGSGAQVGAAGGALAGAAIGSAFFGVGAIPGALIGGLIGGVGGGFFGPKQSVGPNAGANLMLGGGGGIAVGSSGADNRGDVAQAIGFAQGAAETFRRLQAQGIGLTRDVQTQFGSMKGQLFSSVGGGFERSVYRGADSNEAIFAVVKNLIQSGALAGTGTTGQILRGGQFGSMEELGKALDFGKMFDQFTGATKAATGLAKSVEDLNKQFDDAAAQAQKYGLSIAQIEAGRAAALSKMRQDFNTEIQSQILAITDPIASSLDAIARERQQALDDATAIGADIVAVEQLYALKRQEILEQSADDFTVLVKNVQNDLRQMLADLMQGPLSALSPGDRYAAAARAFGGAEEMATKGKLPENFADITRQFLEASQLMFASSERYAEDYRRATNLLNDLLGLPRAVLGGYVPGGMTVVGERGPEIVKLPGGARVFARGEMPPANDNGGDVVASIMNLGRSSSEIVFELRGLRGDFQAMARKLDILLAGRMAQGQRQQVAA